MHTTLINVWSIVVRSWRNFAATVAPEPRRSTRDLRSFGLRSPAFWAAALGLAVAAAMPAASALEEMDHSEVAAKSISGQVIFISSRAISVEYDSTETSSKETLLPINDKTALDHLRSVKELKRGDLVRVEFEQTFREDASGQRVVLGTVATRVALVKRTVRKSDDGRFEFVDTPLLKVPVSDYVDIVKSRNEDRR